MASSNGLSLGSRLWPIARLTQRLEILKPQEDAPRYTALVSTVPPFLKRAAEFNSFSLPSIDQEQLEAIISQVALRRSYIFNQIILLHPDFLPIDSMRGIVYLVVNPYFKCAS